MSNLDIKYVDFVCTYRGNVVCDTRCSYTANNYNKDTIKKDFNRWKERVLSNLDFYLDDENETDNDWN